MSVRFAALTDNYTATTGIPSGNTFTVTFWAYLTVDQNNFVGLFRLQTTGAEVLIDTDSDGTTLKVWDDVSNAAGFGAFAMSIGTWYQVGLVVNGAAATSYIGPGGGSLTTTSVANFTPPNPPTNLAIGSDTGAFLNGRIAAFKLWSAALSATEVTAELAQFAPTRNVNLLRYHPFHVAETTDYSGNGNTLTAGSTATATEADPPIPEVAVQGPPTNRARLTRASCW